MMVTLVSQCEKKALRKTRRVLDAFANRIGNNTWQTVITQEGLDAVRKLLRKNASRNTAVACHWIRSRSRSELIWVVGRREKFNLQGIVPVNTTRKDLQKRHWENNWHRTEIIALLSAIAGLFHDFGKANKLFQAKLGKWVKNALHYEPYRHEWVSLRLFESFVKGLSDQEWLQKLQQVSPNDERQLLENLICDGAKGLQPLSKNTPFLNMPSVAKVVAWLIISHHRLPKYINDKKSNVGTDLDYVNEWLDHDVQKYWNSRNYESSDIKEKHYKENWQFEHGTPLKSQTWCAAAQNIALRALQYPGLLSVSDNWLDDRFVSHMARLSLMLADHVYSNRNAQKKSQDQRYKSYANTDRQTHKKKQKLDEHNIGVGKNAYLFARKLPWLRYSLPSIANVRALKNDTKNTDFQWQNKAYKLAVEIQ